MSADPTIIVARLKIAAATWQTYFFDGDDDERRDMERGLAALTAAADLIESQARRLAAVEAEIAATEQMDFGAYDEDAWQVIDALCSRIRAALGDPAEVGK